MLGLFRIIERYENPDKPGGSLKIDGISISSMPVTHLRKNISMIPQVSRWVII